jgi:Flp pilus assembly protein TadD
MGQPATVAEALRLVQRGDAGEALKVASACLRDHPRDARAHMALGIALRLLGRLPDARAVLERAAALAPGDYAPAYELGVLLDLQRDTQGALARYRQALSLRPSFAAARFAAARSLAEAGRFAEALDTIEPALRENPADAFARHEKGWILHRSRRAGEARPFLEAAAAADPGNAQWALDAAKAIADSGDIAAARAAYEQVSRAHPKHVPALVACGRFHVSRGEFAAAASLFEAAAALDCADAALPIYLAQAELVQRNWERGWRAYARREPRRAFEAARAANGGAYRVPALAELSGRDVTLVGEQGLGDVLFYLRFAPPLAAASARLEFAGDARLASLLRRSGLFRAVREASAASEVAAPLPLLVADLPSVAGIPLLPAPLRIEPDANRLAAWRATLAAAGPRPWIGITWRAGTPSDVLAHGLFKTVALDRLCAAIRPWGGTVFAIQRRPREGELAAAGAALGSTVHDLARMNDDLEDALAVVALLDRHVGVSNTNMHLAAMAGATADVLVPFPPEWRWTVSGESPWFPGLRVHRQNPGGDWSGALAALGR